MPDQGYRHPAYAASLAEFGTPLALTACGGWVLLREIPGERLADATGCYPLFCCSHWQALAEDLETLAKHAIAVCMVADPFGAFDVVALGRVFDVVRPFKQHFVVDLASGCARPSSHHRYYANRALRQIDVDVSGNPVAHLNEWVGLFANLVSRHGITGVAAFSERSFALQFAVPGIVMLRAAHRGTTVAAQLWYVDGDVAYSHLAAATQEGYRLRASYALHGAAIAYFASRVRYLDLGSGPGAMRSESDGLEGFKRGWATGTRPAYFCARVLDPTAYRSLTGTTRIDSSEYFPLYRQPKRSEGRP